MFLPDEGCETQPKRRVFQKKFCRLFVNVLSEVCFPGVKVMSLKPGDVFSNITVTIVQDADPKRRFNLPLSFSKERKVADDSVEEGCDSLSCGGQE